MRKGMFHFLDLPLKGKLCCLPRHQFPIIQGGSLGSPDVQAHGLQISVVLVTAAPSVPPDPDMSLNALSDNCLRAVKSELIGLKRLPDTLIYTILLHS